MERNGIDYVFAMGLIFVAVIAVAELQYAHAVLGQDQLSNWWTQITFVFKGTIVPLFVLVAIWLAAMIFPHVKIPLARRRYLKEFCWTLLGNMLALEIVLLNFLSAGIHNWLNVSLMSGKIFEFIPSFFLTLLATWQYRRIDSTKNQSATKFGLITVLEHGLIYFISYLLLLMIIASSTAILAI
jgi:hypothetical protein